MPAGVDVLIVSTPRTRHSKGVLEGVRWVKQNYPKVDVIGGKHRHLPPPHARALVEYGASTASRVGIGPRLHLHHAYRRG